MILVIMTFVLYAAETVGFEPSGQGDNLCAVTRATGSKTIYNSCSNKAKKILKFF